MTTEYDRIIKAGAEAIESTMRAAAWQGRRIQAWWKPGVITATFNDVRPDGDGWEPLRPIGDVCWSVIPYSAIHSRLWHGCRRLPILTEV